MLSQAWRPYVINLQWHYRWAEQAAAASWLRTWPALSQAWRAMGGV